MGAPSHNRKYSTGRDEQGRVTFTMYRVWRPDEGPHRGSGYISFTTEEEAEEHLRLTRAARLDMVVVTVLQEGPNGREPIRAVQR